MKLNPFRRSREEREYKLNAALSVLAHADLSSLSAAGVPVTPEKALTFMAVFACVRVLAEDVAGLPLPIYRRLSPRGKERAPDYPLYRLLHDQPNPEMTSFQWRETGMLHLGLWGNAYSEIEWGAGRPVALWPIPPKRVRVERDGRTRELNYHIELDEGTRDLPARQVLHIAGLSLNGLTGLSPIGLAREAIGLGLAVEEYGSRFFSNDASPSIAVKVPGGLSDIAFKRIESTWNQKHRGLSKAHRIALLEEGMSIEKIGIPPDDAQFLETAKFSVRQVARAYRMQPHKIADLDNATFTNIEQQAIEHVVDTLRPWLVRWEQRINMQLIPPEDRATYFAEFVVDGLLRGDSVARGDFYTKMFQIGAMSPNDIREGENRNPIPGGDAYYVSLQMIPVGEEAPILPPMRALDSEEKRAARPRSARRRIGKAYRPLFVEAAKRIVRREEADIMPIARKAWNARGIEDFQAFVDDYYGTGAAYGSHGEYVKKQMAPVIHSYVEAIQGAAADEIGAEPGMTPAMTTFATAYTAFLVGRWVGSSRGQVSEVVKGATVAGVDPVAALQGRFDEWGDKRPDKLADWETKQAGNATTVETYKAAGVQPTLSAGGTACPLCQDADGQPVSDVGYPPLHDGCECDVVPG